jgi:hypothetical protein
LAQAPQSRPIDGRAGEKRLKRLLKNSILAGAAVHRCDKSVVLIGALAPEITAADFLSKL